MNNMRIVKVPIMLDRERYLCYDFNALCDLQDEYGDGSLEEIFQKGLVKQDIKMMRKLLYVGLKADDETLTERQVGAMIPISAEALHYLVDKLSEAINGSMPETTEEEGKPTPAKKAPARKKKAE